MSYNIDMGEFEDNRYFDDIYEPLFVDERTCSHCVNNSACWPAVIESRLIADHFALRSGWTEGRIDRHMRSIVGQICNNFTHINPDCRRQTEEPDRSWDSQENNNV